MSDKLGKNTDAWLADEASVSRAYRELNQAQPPKHLDDAILAEARRVAAGQDDNVIRVQRWRKWTMPAALAATVVFAIPLVVRVFNTAPSDFDLNRSAKTTMAERTSNESDTAYQDLAEQEGAAPIDTVSPQAMFDEQRVAAKPAAPAQAAPFASEGQARAEPSAALQDLAPGDSNLAASPAALTAADPRSVEYDRTDASAIASNESDRKHNTGLSKAADESGYAYAPAPGNAAELNARPAREVLANDPSESQRQDRRRMTSRSNSTAADDAPAQAGSSMAVADMEQKQDIDEREEIVVTANRLDDQWLEPTQWLDDIARLYERGHSTDARRELGTFFSVYPDYTLPTNFPIQAEDALLDKPVIFDNEAIVPEATTWLRGIGLMAYRGDIDQARTQLSRFVRIYPDYPLPADFPLSRDDARAIER